MTGSRARLVLNPAAGTDQALANAAVINDRLASRYGPLEIAVSRGAGDAEAAARRAARDGCDIIFAAGGDGTLNEVVNGIASAGALDRTTFGVVPLGTGNDFARGLGIPAEVDAALEILTAGRTIRCDLGRLNGRLFVNTSAGGFIAQVSETVTPELKSIAGRLAYLIGGAQALIEFEPVRATLEAEPGRIRVGAGVYAVAVCNSRMIGGGRLIAPDAIIDDGLLDLCLIEAMSAVEFVTLLRRVADGGHVQDPRVRYHQVSRATIAFDRTVLVNTDGEVLETDRCEYEVLPRAATFLAGEAPFAAEAEP